jgi:hypothetical protein
VYRREAVQGERQGEVAHHQGRDDIAHLLTISGRCLDRVGTRAEYAAGSRSVSESTATVGGDAIDGVLVRQVDGGGMVEEMGLLLRPMHALHTAVTLMRDALIDDPLPSTGRRRR